MKSRRMSLPPRSPPPWPDVSCPCPAGRTAGCRATGAARTVIGVVGGVGAAAPLAALDGLGAKRAIGDLVCALVDVGEHAHVAVDARHGGARARGEAPRVLSVRTRSHVRGAHRRKTDSGVTSGVSGVTGLDSLRGKEQPTIDAFSMM